MSVKSHFSNRLVVYRKVSSDPKKDSMATEKNLISFLN